MTEGNPEESRLRPAVGGPARGTSSPPPIGPPPPRLPGPRFEPEPTLLGRLKGPGWIVLCTVAAACAVLVLSYGSYSFGQAPHRLYKVVAGGALAGVILLKPEWALFGLPLVFPFVEWLPKSPVPFLSTINLLIYTLIFSWMGRAVLQRRPIFRPSPWNLPLGLFLGWATVSWLHGTLLGGYPGSVFRSFQIYWTAIVGLLLFFVVYNSVNTWTQVRRLTIWLCVASGMGLLGILREYADYGGGRRVAGGIADINKAGAFYASATLFTVGILAVGPHRIWRQLLLMGSTVASSAAMIIPGSRGALIAFLAGSLPLAMRAGLVGILVTGLLISGLTFFAPDFVRERMVESWDALQAGGGDDRYDSLNESSGGRFDIWKAILGVVVQHPIFGIGFGRLPSALAESLERAKAGHNMYLEVLAEMGIPGLFLLLWIFGVGFLEADVLRRTPGLPRGIGLGYQYAVLALLVSNLFGQRLFHISIAGFYAFITALVFRSRVLLSEPGSEGGPESDQKLALVAGSRRAR